MIRPYLLCMKQSPRILLPLLLTSLLVFVWPLNASAQNLAEQINQAEEVARDNKAGTDSARTIAQTLGQAFGPGEDTEALLAKAQEMAAANPAEAAAIAAAATVFAPSEAARIAATVAAAVPGAATAVAAAVAGVAPASADAIAAAVIAAVPTADPGTIYNAVGSSDGDGGGSGGGGGGDGGGGPVLPAGFGGGGGGGTVNTSEPAPTPRPVPPTPTPDSQ